MKDLELFKNAINSDDESLSDAMLRYFFNTDEPDYQDWLFSVAQEYCVRRDINPKRLALFALEDKNSGDIYQKKYKEYFDKYKSQMSTFLGRIRAFGMYA